MTLTTVGNDAYINAKSVCGLLRKLYGLYVGKPITLVLDNTTYQKYKSVKRYAKILGIELLFLPSYSPQLNRTANRLIKRLWKLVKKKVLHGKYYADFKDFKNALQQFLTDLAHVKDEPKALLT